MCGLLFISSIFATCVDEYFYHFSKENFENYQTETTIKMYLAFACNLIYINNLFITKSFSKIINFIVELKNEKYTVESKYIFDKKAEFALFQLLINNSIKNIEFFIEPTKIFKNDANLSFRITSYLVYTFNEFIKILHDVFGIL